MGQPQNHSQMQSNTGPSAPQAMANSANSTCNILFDKFLDKVKVDNPKQARSSLDEALGPPMTELLGDASPQSRSGSKASVSLAHLADAGGGVQMPGPVGNFDTQSLSGMSQG